MANSLKKSTTASIIDFWSVFNLKSLSFPALVKAKSDASLKAGFHMIADDRGSQIAESSAIVCDHMETHFCDRLRSCDRDRRRSQKIEPCSIFCDRLRSSAIVCDPAIIWKPKFCDLR